MHMVLAAGNSLFPASCSVHSENILTCMYRKMLNFSRPNVPRINSSCLTFLHMPSILMYYTIYESISDAAAHNFGWDDTGGTGDWNKFGANNEICGRDCKVLPYALSLHLLLALLCLILKTLSSLDTDWRNNQAQPASYPSRFQSVSVVKVSLASTTEHSWCDLNHRRQDWPSSLPSVL